MTVPEFINATSRLEVYFGKEYDKQQLSIMHEELQIFELGRYKQLISLAIRECKFLPKVADIIKLDRENPTKGSSKEILKIECKKCNSTGYIFYKKKIDNGDTKLINTYAAICDCGNAKPYKGWEILDKEHRSEFYIPIANELSITD